MARSSIIPILVPEIEIDIFSNKSALILFWLLANHNQVKNEGFSINELSREAEVSIGLVHKVIKQLEYKGIIISKGFRTNKRFYLKLANKLIVDWVKEYNLLKKTKIKGFYLPTSDKINLKKLRLIPALHSAASELYHLKVTNLRVKEFYLSDWKNLSQVINKLELQELDRGYEFILIKPYYSILVERVLDIENNTIWKKAYNILVFLDLCHFPLRGLEQAEVLFRNSNLLTSICQWSEIENVLG